MKIQDFMKNVNYDAKTIVTVDGKKIEIIKELPPIGKYSIVRLSVEAGFDDANGMYDILYSDVLFNVLLVKYYTNIEIEDLYTSGDNLFTAYGVFVKSGVLSQIKLIRKIEIEELLEMKKKHETQLKEQQKSFSILTKGIKSLGGDVSPDFLEDLNSDATQETIKNIRELKDSNVI